MDGIVPIKSDLGEEKAWSIISTLDPGDVCERADVAYDPEAGLYRLDSFGMGFCVSPGEKRIFSDAPESDLLLVGLGDLFRLSALWYLIGAKNVPLSGRLVKPSGIKGGQRFFSGTYVLPLDKIEKKYGTDRDAFLRKGKEFGAEVPEYGAVSLRLFPFPRVSVAILLWLQDDEFPARADLLFDSSCEFHIEMSDILWAISIMSITVML